MRRDIDDSSQGPSRTSPVDQVEDVPVVESLSLLILSSATPPLPVVETPVRSLTPNNRSLGSSRQNRGEHAHLHVPQSRGAVSSDSIASTDLLYYVEPLPLDQFLLHDTQTVRNWPDNARNEIFAVARRDIAVARRNLTSLTRYLDMHDTHLAACAGGLDDHITFHS